MMNKNMLKQAQQMQARLAAVQEEIAVARTEATVGGGMVKVTANGLQRVTSISIEKEVIDPDDIELLEDLVMAGVNKALEEASGLAKQEMAKAAGGLIPPGTDLSQFGL